MTTQTLTPNATIGSTGAWGIQGATAHQTVQSQDWTFLIANDIASEGTVELGYTTYTLLTDERVAGVRLGVFDANIDFGGSINVIYQIGKSGGVFTTIDLSYSSPIWFAYRYSSWYQYNGSNEWVQTDIDNIETKFTHNSTVANMDRDIDQAWLEVDVRKRPVVNVTGPSEGATNISLSPTIQWIFTGNDGQAQTRYKVRVFSAAQYQAGGFDPTGSTATYDSGFINGTATTHALPASTLAGGTTYRAYVITSKDFNGTNWDSSYDFNGFTTLATPTVVVVTPTEGSTLTATNNPNGAWTFNVSGGNPQSKYRAKIFTSAVYGGGGFDPETSSAAWDSGEVTSATTSFATSSVLVDGTYRLYVKAAYTNGADTVYSAWDNNTFTITTDKPATPSTPTPTADPNNGRITVTIQDNNNRLTLNQGSLETDTTGWAVDTNCTIARTTAQFLNGAASLQMTASSAATMAARTLSGTSGIPVTVGTTYTAVSSHRTAVTGRTVTCAIRWYDSGGATLSTSTGTGITDTTGGWTQATVTAAAPASAAFAAVVITVTSPASAEVHYVDQIKLAAGSSTVWSRGGLSALINMVVEYSDDGGTTWATHPDTPIIPVTNTQLATLQDYRPTIGTARVYRAYDTATGAPTSATSATSGSATLTATTWWLKDVKNSALNIQLVVLGTTFDVSTHEAMGVFRPLGRKNAVIVTDVVEGEEFDLVLEFTTVAAFNAFKAIRDPRRVLILYSPFVSKQWWVKIGRDVTEKVNGFDPNYRNVKVSFIEQDAPV